MSSFGKYIEYFDFFGNRFSPTVHYSNQSTTIVGGFFGLGFLFFTGFLFYSFSLNFFNKDEPNLIEKTEIGNVNSPLEMPFGFSIHISLNYHPKIPPEKRRKDIEFLNKNMDRLISPQALYFRANKTQNFTLIPLRECKVSDFKGSKALESWEVANIRKSKCFDMDKMNISLYMKYPSKDTKSIFIRFFECYNTEENNNYCLSEAEKNYYFKVYDLRPFFIHRGVKFFPKKHRNPFDFYYDDFYTKSLYVPYHIPYAKYLYIQNFILETDDGIFKSNYKIEKHQRIEKSVLILGGDFYQTDYKLNKRKFLNQLIMRISSKSIIVSRNYPKLQDVIANVTSFMGIDCFFDTSVFTEGLRLKD